jgi:hypothetical protein
VIYKVREKLPAWLRTFRFDFSSFAEVVAGETISSPSVTATPSGLTIGSPTIPSGTSRVEATVTGGAGGQRYNVTCSVTTSGGATLTIEGFLDVVKALSGTMLD